MTAHENEADRGFTLIELLVVMIIIGILAAVAVPAFLAQKRKAYETSAKSDVKALVKDGLSYYVDGIGTLSVSGADGAWEITDGAGQVVATGSLSAGNVVSANSYFLDSSNYCVSVRNTKVDAQFWTANATALQAGDCAP